MKEGIVIAGFAGIGKTTLAKKYQNVIDLDAAKFAYSDIGLEYLSMEERKCRRRSPNPKWPNNYIKAKIKASKEYDIVLVWDRPDVVAEYLKHNLDFTFCYPAGGS